MKTSRRPMARVVGVLIAALAMFVFPAAGSASALTYTNTYGSFAGGTFPSQMIGGELCTMMYGPLYYGCVYTPTVRSNSFTVDRSRATTGTQIVTVDFKVWKYGTSWTVYTNQRSQSTIGAGKASVAVAGLNRGVVNGYFAVTATVTWWNSTSQRLGSYDISWSGNSDYTCRTTAVRCAPGPGWVKLGQ